MPYGRLLKKVLSDSNYTSAEICKEFEKRGKKIDKSYLSKLLNNKIAPPSEEISKTIAEICNVDERLLILEGYIDKAPKEVIEVLSALQNITKITSLGIFENTFENTFENNIEKIAYEEIKKELNKEPLSQFLLSFTEIDEEAMINITENFGLEMIGNDYNLNYKIDKPVGIPVKDNSMFPLIPQNSEVMLLFQTEYETGDILAIKVKKSDEFLIRYAYMDNDKIILTALNKEYEKLEYKLEDIIILGKAVKVISNI